MEPVEHHHGEFLDRAIAEDARVFFVNGGCDADFFTGLDPDGIGVGCGAVERKQEALCCWVDSGVMDVADVVVPDGLLEIDLERAGRRGNSGFEPTAVVLHGRHFGGVTTGDVEDCGSIGPRSEEADHFPVGSCRGGSARTARTCFGTARSGRRRRDGFCATCDSNPGIGNGDNDIGCDWFRSFKRRN